MVRFETLTTEKVYPYVKAKAAAEYKNGVFGEVVDEVFTIGATKFKVAMNVETGDDAKSDDFVIEKDGDMRIADLSLVPNGTILNVTAGHLPSDAKKGDKMVSAATGNLVVPETAPTEKYLEVIEMTNYGCRAKIVQ